MGQKHQPDKGDNRREWDSLTTGYCMYDLDENNNIKNLLKAYWNLIYPNVILLTYYTVWFKFSQEKNI